MRLFSMWIAITSFLISPNVYASTSYSQIYIDYFSIVAEGHYSIENMHLHPHLKRKLVFEIEKVKKDLRIEYSEAEKLLARQQSLQAKCLKPKYVGEKETNHSHKKVLFYALYPSCGKRLSESHTVELLEYSDTYKIVSIKREALPYSPLIR